MRITCERCHFGCLVLLGMLLSFSTAAAQEKKTEPKKSSGTFTDRAEAGPDYRIQGEYEGIAGKEKLGAQVVAKGDGKFEVYFLEGGLPGAGWDATKERVKLEAKTVDGKTTVDGKFDSKTKVKDKAWLVKIADGRLTGTVPVGEVSLTRVERKSPTLGAKPPAGALILFRGADGDEWAKSKVFDVPNEAGVLEAVLFCGTSSKKKLGAGTLHIEFRTPFQPKAGGQGRGNSGVFVQGFEVQVLDSFGLTGEKNECGAFYGKAKPAVNMCLPPLTWQTYDIEIKAGPDGSTVATVLHNGVKVHDNFVLRKSPPAPTSINLQNHGNPVVFRNIWFVESK